MRHLFQFFLICHRQKSGFQIAYSVQLRQRGLGYAKYLDISAMPYPGCVFSVLHAGAISETIGGLFFIPSRLAMSVATSLASFIVESPFLDLNRRQ